MNHNNILNQSALDVLLDTPRPIPIGKRAEAPIPFPAGYFSCHAIEAGRFRWRTQPTLTLVMFVLYCIVLYCIEFYCIFVQIWNTQHLYYSCPICSTISHSTDFDLILTHVQLVAYDFIRLTFSPFRVE
jgi:hypothetical protein